MMVFLARRYAFSSENRHRITSVRIASGLALCLFAITMVLAFMQALQTNQFEDIRTFESFDVHIPLSFTDLKKGAALVGELQELPLVDHAFLYSEIPVLLQGLDGSTLAGRIRAIESKGPFAEQLHPYRGQLFTPGTLASSYLHLSSVKLGESVEVTLLKKGKQATVIPTQKSLTVGSIFYTSMYDFDSSTFLTDLPTLYSLNENAPLSVGIFSSAKSEAVARQVRQMDPTLEPVTWKEANASLYGAMQLEQGMMALMLFLMIVVILIHIRNSSKRLLLAKQREIAMLRSMGLPKRRVQQLFVLQALIVSAVGAISGGLLSFCGVLAYPAFSEYIYTSLGVHLKLVIRPLDLLFLVVLVLFFSGIASYLGTRRILKADIMEMFAHDEVQ
ncbi:FtsX-like permease family protein [Sphaerochaeta sp. PS]|uniref:ABC transporter permease n=1 Tax=Sphaerochaeta sp. PS TaxID=3076336 RepID=UPI0028A4B47B|nr:FtsX-like permease family protein [Sphaerochaeta sp. PS]MDT4761427.1 FtsX-like permease family protein [Sphaerochaeta sp. PS]